MSVPRIGLSVGLGALAVGFGVALMATAGYLISRAAEQPPILSLGTTIVAVRFFGLGRPLLRYLDRLASHDLALRSLGRIRTRFYERIEPLAPGELAGYRRGELLGRMVGDVDVLEGLYLRCARAAARRDRRRGRLRSLADRADAPGGGARARARAAARRARRAGARAAARPRFGRRGSRRRVPS